MPDTIDVYSNLQEAVLLHHSGQLKQAAMFINEFCRLNLKLRMSYISLA